MEGIQLVQDGIRVGRPVSGLPFGHPSEDFPG